MQTREHPDGLAALSRQAFRAVAEDAFADQAGCPRPSCGPIHAMTLTDGESAESRASTRLRAHDDCLLDSQEREIEEPSRRLGEPGGTGFAPDGGSAWPTSGGVEP